MSRTLSSQLLGRALTAGLFRTTATNSLTSGRLFLDWSSPLPLLAGICIACLLIQAAPATAENLPSADFYSTKVKPLLTEKCISCHGPTRAEGGLRLDAAELIHRGATSGPVLNLDAPGTSLLLTRIASTDPAERMPPTSEGVALKSEEQAILQQWLSSGAPKPADETYLSSPADHWAYRPIVRPSLSDSTAPPIDAFIDRQLQQAGLAPLPTATPTTLLRRLHVDLLGLPPTSEDLQHADELTDPRRFARYVDRLLTRPEYGERWGRHWMDVWRYSDWDGYKDELRGSQRHVWRWRDWIIESLNESKPYATMITEMLAADELHPDDANSVRATGFLARDFHTSNRNIWLDATVEHTAKAFLGLTINCAKCHDHKYDPIAQVDYYEFRAIFEPHHVRTDPVPGTTDPKQNGVSRVYDSQLDAPTYLFVRGDDKHPNKEQPLAPAVPSLFSISFEPQPIPLPLASTKPWLQPFAREDLIAAAQTKVNTARTQLDKVASDQTKGDQDRQLAHHKLLVAETDLQSLKLRYAIELARLESNNNGSTNSAAIELLLDAAREQERLWVKYSAEVVVLEKQAALKTAEASEAKDEAKRNANIEKAKKELADAENKLVAAQKAIIDRQGDLRPIGPTYPDHSTGRRTALARWITDPQNPLTARVAVNHLWMRIMGKPLVDNVFDFGLKTATPKQIELLDYLARELIDHQWDLKYLLRQIVSSSAINARRRPRPPTNHLDSRLIPRTACYGEPKCDAPMPKWCVTACCSPLACCNKPSAALTWITNRASRYIGAACTSAMPTKSR